MQSYKVTILGKNYDLPARTLDVDERIEVVGNLAKRYASGDMTRREVVQAQHDFVEFVAPGSIPPVEEVDTNELLRACVDIINVYNAPAMEAQAEAQAAKIRKIMEKPDVKKAIDAVKVMKK